MPSIEYCALGSICLSYRLDDEGVSYYLRGCLVKNEEYDDQCEYIEEFGGMECNACRLPLCNWREIPLSDADKEAAEKEEEEEEEEEEE